MSYPHPWRRDHQPGRRSPGRQRRGTPAALYGPGFDGVSPGRENDEPLVGEDLPRRPAVSDDDRLPPAKVEYVEKQPTLEDVFLAVVGDTGADNQDGDTDAGSQDRKTTSTKK
jgi:hypothetical protein